MNWKQLISAKRFGMEEFHEERQENRSEFQRDYDRLIFSAPFRRLQNKTQVFPLPGSIFVHNRLTHSLEVSCVGRSLGNDVAKAILERQPELESSFLPEIGSIVSAACLAHDLGNPPFGHFGEFTIRQWFRENFPKLYFKGQPVTELLTKQMMGDFLNLEGNAQALRVLTKLHVLIDLGNGMNLTYALLNTIIKYPVSSLEINKNSGDIKYKKMGYFTAEQPVFEDITKSTGAVGYRYPLTFLLESADDIAYKTADIEDAAIKKLISFTELLSELESPDLREKCVSEEEQKVLEKSAADLRHCLDSSKKRGLPLAEKKAVQRWTVNMQSALIYAASDAFVDNYEAIMAGEFKRELLSASPMRVVSEALSDIAYRYAFQSSGLLKIELSADAMLNLLLDKITGAALRFGTEQQRMTDANLMSLLSESFRGICRKCSEGKSDAEQAYNRLLLVTDCVCSMTDSYARELFGDLSGINS